MTDEHRSEESPEGRRNFDWLDVVAFTIAAYQIIIPVLLMFFGVILVIYLLLRLWAGT